MSQKNKGIILIITSAFFFALMNMMVRLAGDLPSIEKSFFRNFVAVFFALIALKKSHTPVHIPKGQLKNLLMRSICGTLGILCNYYAIDHLMLADASILNKLSPFFAILFSFLLLKEKIHPFAASCVCIAFIGSLFVIKPGFASVTATPGFYWTSWWNGSRNRIYVCSNPWNKRCERSVYRPLFLRILLYRDIAISYI